MYYFEIMNIKTNEAVTAKGNGLAQACKSIGWNVRDCKCVYRVKEEV